MIRAVVAMDSKRGIANQQGIPWKLREEHQHFKQLTIDSTVLMGFRTHESLVRALRQRRNMVWCKPNSTLREGFEPVNNLQEFLDNATEDIWVIGGEELYRQALKYCQEVYVTVIDGDFNCTKFFPELTDFSLARSVEASEGDTHYTYQTWVRNSIA